MKTKRLFHLYSVICWTSRLFNCQAVHLYCRDADNPSYFYIPTFPALHSLPIISHNILSMHCCILYFVFLISYFYIPTFPVQHSSNNISLNIVNTVLFLATLVALHFTPVSESVGCSFELA